MSYDSAFLSMMDRLLQFEGGFTLTTLPTEKDMTYAGIYRYVFPNWEGWKYIDEYSPKLPPVDIMKPLVYDFYYNTFYRQLLAIDNIRIREILFLMGTNQGMGTVIRMLQRVVGAPVTGRVDSRTNMYVNNFISTYGLDILECKFKNELAKRYLSIVKNNPKKKIFLKGWFNRLNAV